MNLSRFFYIPLTCYNANQAIAENRFKPVVWNHCQQIEIKLILLKCCLIVKVNCASYLFLLNKPTHNEQNLFWSIIWMIDGLLKFISTEFLNQFITFRLKLLYRVALFCIEIKWIYVNSIRNETALLTMFREKHTREWIHDAHIS